LGGGPPGFMRASTRLALLEKSSRRSSGATYGTITRFGPAFQKVRLPADFVTPPGIHSPHEALTTPHAQRLWPYMHTVWALALSLAATHAVDALFPFLRVLRSVPLVGSVCLWIQQPVTGHDPRRVVALGYLRVLARLAARRSFSQLPHLRHRLSAPKHPPHTLCSLTMSLMVRRH
jgi:hypothetical protein